jgi:hypothetical protein
MYEDQGPTRRDSTRGKTFTNKINYGLNKILKTLARDSKEKTMQEIEHLPNQQRKMEEIETLNIFPSKWLALTLQMVRSC